MKNGLIIDWAGNKYWYKDDKSHREDGPAIELINGDKYWFQNGQWHRLDGPALEYASKIKYWYYQGKHIKCSSQEEFEKFLKFKMFW